jgi:hypothetical protein
MLVAAGTGSLMSASGAYSQGAIGRQEAKTEGALIGLQAKQRELARTEKLNEAIAAQMVSASTRGIALEGSPLDVIDATVESSKKSQAAEDTGARVSQLAAKSKASQAMKQGRLGAMTSLVQGGTSMVSPFIA